MPSAPDESVVAMLERELHLPLTVCRLLARRGFTDAELAKRYLRPRIEQLHAPSLMRDLDRAVERLSSAVRGKETILVHGDYDVDGICSTTLLVRTIRELGGVAVPFIPNRLTDGYDLGPAGLKAAIESKASVVLTADCGTSARSTVASLCAQGIDVIIADHHLPGEGIPDCLAVLNPRRLDCEYPDKDLAAVGVAFKLALALTEHLGGDATFVYNMMDLVAFATIADVAPLRGENRVMARIGLRLLAKSRNPGLRALIRASGMEGRAITAGRVGYVLAPRLNAVGRLQRALRGVELLLSESDAEANVIARELEELNRERQELDRRTLDEARALMDQLDVDATFGIVLASETWHPGVIGIVASRLVEEYCRPVMLLAIQDGIGKGSGRSIPVFDLHGALRECRDLLVRYGGHKAAAGVTVDSSMIPAFASRFNEVASSRLTGDQLVPDLRIDLEVSVDDLNEDLEKMLRHFEPHGMGNPTSNLLVRNVRLAEAPRVVGEDGLKLRLVRQKGTIDAVGWGMARRLPELRDLREADLVVRLELDEWNGLFKLQARIMDVAAPGTRG
jgi:single-stranded-DNA-specific exonuclease